MLEGSLSCGKFLSFCKNWNRVFLRAMHSTVGILRVIFPPMIELSDGNYVISKIFFVHAVVPVRIVSFHRSDRILIINISKSIVSLLNF